MVAEDDTPLFGEEADYIFEEVRDVRQTEDSSVALFLAKCEKSFANGLFCGESDIGKVLEDIKNQLEYISFKSNCK